MSLLDTFRTQ